MRGIAIVAALACLVPVSALAQNTNPSQASRLWIVAGGASGTVSGDCQNCEEDFPAQHGGALVGDVGYRVSPRLDVGADVFWMQWRNDNGQIRKTAIDAVAQFRPWGSKGFFVKGGAGMAFVRNWVHTVRPDPYFSKALSVVIGAGWVFNPKDRFGIQLFAMQHVGALGDLQTVNGAVNDVTGNFWSVGAAIVIR
jgi:hypothetical protein